MSTVSGFFTTSGSVQGLSPGAPLPRWGKPLGLVIKKEWEDVVYRGVNRFCHECRQLDLVLTEEAALAMAQMDRVLTLPGGSLLTIGDSGSGRRSAISVVATMHQMKLVSPRLSRGYGLKHFKTELKQVKMRLLTMLNISFFFKKHHSNFADIFFT